MAVDGQGNLFIADTFNNRIREVNLSTGIITTVAGNGTPGSTGDNGAAASARLRIPYGVAVDSQGDLFIADSGNNVIRRITTPGAVGANGAIETDTPLIAWQTLLGGVSEELAIVDQTTGETLLVVANLTGADYQLTQGQALPRGHSFTWYIGAVSSGVAISWSGGTHFSIPELAAPTPMGPSGAVTPSIGYDTPTFSWSSVSGAAMYDLYLKDLTTGTVVFDNPNISGSSFTPSSPLLVGHSYLWYIGSEGAAGATGGIAWSAGTRFTLTALTAPTPAGPTGVVPASAGYDTPTFSWSSIPGAAMYELYLKDTTTGALVFNNTDVSGNTFTPSMGLARATATPGTSGRKGRLGPTAQSTGVQPTCSRSPRPWRAERHEPKGEPGA